MTIFAATGHRPPKLGGYGIHVNSKLLKVANAFLSVCKPERIISGMALGWDQELAYAAIKMGIPVTAAVPFEGQESVWPQDSKDRYNAILKKCNVEIVSTGGYAAWKLAYRNEWMVDKADKVVALFNGDYSTGTGHCVLYAKNTEVEVVNLWDQFEALDE